MKFTEQQAREIILVKAIENASTLQLFLTPNQLNEIENSVLKKCSDSNADRAHQFLVGRASGILAATSKRDDFELINTLKKNSKWKDWFSFAIPMLALMLGLLSDQIANPRRVDLLSLPLLGLLAWNFAMYVLLILSLAVSMRKTRPIRVPFNEIRILINRLTSRFGIASGEQLKIATTFLREWRLVIAEITGHRLRVILHMAAAAWACGVIASILIRGLTVEYQAGWESTFLRVDQVHRFLNLIFYPVYELFGAAPFSEEEISNLRFGSPLNNAEVGARWAWLYTGLLLLFIVFPRLILAAISQLRIKELVNELFLDTSKPYFSELTRTVVQIQLDIQLIANGATSAILHRALLTHDDLNPEENAPQNLTGKCLISTEYGDKITITQKSEIDTPSTIRGIQSILRGIKQTASWLWSQGGSPKRDAFGRYDITIAAITDMSTLLVAIELYHKKPVPLLLVMDMPVASDQDQKNVRSHAETFSAKHAGSIEIVALEEFASCWIKDGRLFESFLYLVPNAEAGLKRLASTWSALNFERLNKSMEIIAEYILDVGSQIEIVKMSELPFFPGKLELQEYEKAKEVAKARLIARVNQFSVNTNQSLLKLHRLNERDLEELSSGPTKYFFLNGSNQASSKYPDLIGGIVADSKTWTEESDCLHVSDRMMLALIEVVLLRYISIIHHERRPIIPQHHELVATWKLRLQSHNKPNDSLALAWENKRNGSAFGMALLGKSHVAGMLNGIIRPCLEQLYATPRTEKSNFRKYIPEFAKNLFA